jgi:hypothetical protein
LLTGKKSSRGVGKEVLHMTHRESHFIEWVRLSQSTPPLSE